MTHQNPLHCHLLERERNGIFFWRGRGIGVEFFTFCNCVWGSSSEEFDLTSDFLFFFFSFSFFFNLFLLIFMESRNYFGSVFVILFYLLLFTPFIILKCTYWLIGYLEDISVKILMFNNIWQLSHKKRQSSKVGIRLLER